MKTVLVKLILVVVFAAAAHSSFGGPSRGNGVEDLKESSDVVDWKASSDRFKRQTPTTTTTPKPKKNRPSNIFGLLSELITETRQDTSRAFNEIGTLFNTQFSDSRNATAKEPTSTTTTTATPPSSSSPSGSDSDEENEITTTTEAFRISRNEFFGILRSNVQGIAQLFGKEFRVAIRDSNQNVREFGRDLGNALRPYFN